MEAFGMAAFVVFLFLLMGGSMLWHFSRSGDVLQKWADENGFRLIERHYHHFRRGPFFWTTSKGQTVYRVTVQDANGNTRSGWVRCGSWMWGLASNRAEVRWDD